MNNSDLSIEGIISIREEAIKESIVDNDRDKWIPHERFTYVKQIAEKSYGFIVWLYSLNGRRRRKIGRVFMMTVLTVLLLTLWELWSILYISSTPSYNLPQQKIFIAANFYNNEDILSNFSEQLLELVQILRPENVYVSIFENGSNDNTKFLLHTLQSTLNITSVANTVITDDTPKSYIRRIPYLASLRNKVLEPLREQAEEGNTFDKILFFNDIIWTVTDVLTLLETNGYDYDAACAMDFYWSFYDTFATRELPLSSPNMSYHWPPTPYYPYFYNTIAQQYIYNSEPAQVFSCWNGVAVMNAEPFLKHGVKFRALIPEYRELPFDASECCLVYNDFRKFGYDKVFINPNVKVSYVYRFYLWSNYFLPLINRLFFRYFNHPTPPSLFSPAGIRMQEMIRDMGMFNVTESDRICVQ